VALDLTRLADAAAAGRLIWREHARKRAEERGFAPDDVVSALAIGEVIEDYPDARPFPAVLLLWFAPERPWHLVMAFDEETGEAYIATIYEPTLEKFEPDWRTRKQR
jgi:hypothetical protein